MHENTSGRLTFLVKSMFRRLDKFDGPIFGGRGGGLGVYSGSGAYIPGGEYIKAILPYWAICVVIAC